MAATEERAARLPDRLERIVGEFAGERGARVAAYAPVEKQRAYFILRARTGSEETLYFAALTAATLRIEPVVISEQLPTLMADLMALVKRANDPTCVAVG
jgi:hypothetical protein